MFSTKVRKVMTGRTVMVWLAVTAFAGAGVAAAATGNAPWQGVPRAAEVQPATSEPSTTVVAASSSTFDAPTTTARPAERPGPTAPPHTDATIADPPAPSAPSSTVAETSPTTTTVIATEPVPTTQAPSTEGSTTAAPVTAAPTTAPLDIATTTTAKVDTVVPLGIDLHCNVEGSTVSCSWTGGAVDGFAKFLLLRGDGKVGRVPFMSTDPAAHGYVDSQVPAGSYSYVVVTIDGNSKTLVHSNPVFVQIGAAG